MSSSFPSPIADQRFEKLVRACWGLPDVTMNNASIERNGCDRSVVGAHKNYGDETIVRRPVRVVVTRVDGSVSVEDVFVCGEMAYTKGQPTDIASSDDKRSNTAEYISENQADDIREQLVTRGIHAVHVRLVTVPPRPPLPPPPFANGNSNCLDNQAANEVASDEDSPHRSPPGVQPSTEELRTARLGPAGGSHSTGGGGRVSRGSSGYDDCLGLDQGLLR